MRCPPRMKRTASEPPLPPKISSSSARDLEREGNPAKPADHPLPADASPLLHCNPRATTICVSIWCSCTSMGVQLHPYPNIIVAKTEAQVVLCDCKEAACWSGDLYERYWGGLLRWLCLKIYVFMVLANIYRCNEEEKVSVKTTGALFINVLGLLIR